MAGGGALISTSGTTAPTDKARLVANPTMFNGDKNEYESWKKKSDSTNTPTKTISLMMHQGHVCTLVHARQSRQRVH